MILCPDWLATMEKKAPRAPHTRLCRNRYYLKAAALAYSPDGKLDKLAKDLGIARSTLARAYADTYGVISPELAVAVERLVGPSIITRAILRPDLFA